MESGNSSSMQSSSGGDDQEYESSGGLMGSSSNYFLGNSLNANTNTSFNANTTTLPSQFNNPPMFMLSSSAQQPPSLLQPQSSVSHHQHQSSYLDALPSQQSNYHNLMFWKHNQHLGTGVGGGGLADDSSVNNPNSTANINNVSTHHGSAGGSLLVSSSAHQLQPGSNSALQSTSQKHSNSSAGAGAGAGVGAGGGGGAAGVSGASSSGGSGKNPRKRTRASRRAPTTVLTTDTSNFRAMVQEFTGIPSSPFSAAASPLISRRLTDLLTGSASTLGTTLQPPYVGHSTSSLERLLAGYNSNSSTYNNFPLRPSAHKLSTTINNTQQILNTTSNPTTISPLNNLTFQSLLQSTPSPRYQPSLAGAGLLPPNVGSFQDLSGVIGSDPMFGFSPIRLTPDVGGSTGGLRGGGGVESNEESGDHGEGNIGAADNDNNNVSNQQVVGSISGGGASNYNVNMNCARDKGIDSSNPNRGSAQGTLGDFLG